MRIARTLDWKGERLIQSRLYHDQSPGSIPMDGNATAQASITPQWLPDSPKTGAPCGNRRTSAGGHFLRNHSLFELVNAERLSDLIVSLLPRVLRQCALASLGQNRSTYQFAMDRLPSAEVPDPFILPRPAGLDRARGAGPPTVRPATSGQQPAVEVRPSLGVCDGPGALIERPTASGNFTTGCQPAIDSMRSTSSRVSSIP